MPPPPPTPTPEQQWQPQPQQQWQPLQPEPQQPEPPTVPVTPPQPPKKKGKGLMWLFISLGVLLVAGLGAAAYFFLLREPARADFADDDEGIVLVDDKDDSMDDADDYDMDDEETGDTGVDNDIIPAEEEEEEEQEPQQLFDDDEYLLMTGDADGFPLSLRLHVDSNSNVSGQYKNEQQGTTMHVTGTRNDRGVITLRGREGSKIYTFSIAPSGHIYTGTFSSSSGQERELHLTAEHVTAAEMAD